MSILVYSLSRYSQKTFKLKKRSAYIFFKEYVHNFMIHLISPKLWGVHKYLLSIDSCEDLGNECYRP